MRTADTILNIILDRGKRKLPLDDVYRQLYNPDFYLRSYAKMYKNAGAMTPGTTGETVDGMSLGKIDRVIEAIRYERWNWPPVRRVYIDKPKGGKRPLGIPDWSPKVVQDIVRSILEAYYEPQFSDHSHGFRPKRGCQSALTKIHNTWNGTKWFIEGDIKGCFENIDHHLLMNILRKNIHDNRFLRLIEGALKAGYCEEWTYHPSLSGTPQGGTRRCSFLTKAIVGPRWSAQRWSACAMSSPRAVWTGSMSTRRIAWPANMPIKSCWSMSSDALGVEVIFLNRALGQSPEDDLLLQVQGMIAEYERAKIIERHRRGKRHAARVGAVNVLERRPLWVPLCDQI